VQAQASPATAKSNKPEAATAAFKTVDFFILTSNITTCVHLARQAAGASTTAKTALAFAYNYWNTIRRAGQYIEIPVF